MTPKLSTLVTSPCPNRCCQMRLTITRGVSGFLALVNHWASSSRPLCFGFSLDALGTAIADRNPRGTMGPIFSASPRMRTVVSPAVLPSRTPSATGPFAAGSVSAISSS